MIGRSFSADGMTLEAVRVPPNFRFLRHVHEQPHLCFLIGGGFDEAEHRGRRRCNPGITRVSPAGDSHTIDFSDRGSDCLVMTLDDPLENARLFRERTFRYDDWLANVARDTFHALLNGSDTDSLTLEHLGWELIAQLKRSTDRRAPPPAWLRRVRDRLSETPELLSVGQLAGEEGVAREHLARSFRAHYGLSAADFGRRVRLDAACSKIATDQASLADIATEFGFADQSHLTRACVRYKGVTPREYHKRSRRSSLPQLKMVG